jgi:hypothetical protein
MRQNIPNRDRGAAGGTDSPRTSPHGMPLEGQVMPGRRDHLQPADDVELPDPHLRYDITGRRCDRSGTEPRTARSDYGLRLFLSGVFAPLFLVGALVFAAFAARTGPDSAPSRSTLVGLAIVCAVLALTAVVDLLVIIRRRAQTGPRR